MVKINNRQWTGFALSTLLLSLSGCSVFSPVKLETPTRYLIDKIPSMPKKQTHSSVLLVLMPETSALYNTIDMAYSIKPFQIAYFAKNQWADTPPQMLQPLLVQTLQSTHYFHAVATPGISHYDFALATQILDLHQDFTHHPARLHLKLQAQLTRASTNSIIGVKTCSISEPMWQRNPNGGVRAANVAVSRCLKEIADFVISNGKP